MTVGIRNSNRLDKVIKKVRNLKKENQVQNSTILLRKNEVDIYLPEIPFIFSFLHCTNAQAVKCGERHVLCSCT